MSSPASPPLTALVALARAGVPFCVIGVSGINFYALDPSHVVRTEDVDVLLAPRIEVLRAALAALAGIGFSFRAGGEPFLDVGDEAILRNVLAPGATIEARDETGAQLDLMTSGLGLGFDDLSSDAVAFRLGEIEVRVGPREAAAREGAGGPPEGRRVPAPLRSATARAGGRAVKRPRDPAPTRRIAKVECELSGLPRHRSEG